MRQRRALPAAAAALALTASPLVGTASADPSEVVTGTIQQLAPPAVTAPPNVTGKATHLSLRDMARTAGDVLFTPAGAAPAVTDYECVIVEGKATFRCRGQGSGTSTVAGVGTGELASRLDFSCTEVTPGAFLCEGRIRLDGVSGGIEGVRATGTFKNTGVPGQSTYTLRLHRH